MATEADSAIDVERITAELAPGSRLAKRLPGYEPRESQLEMTRAVARTLKDGGLLVVEAGTGTGKSLAYLVPAIEWARSQGERVVVSTRTINLQEQLLHTDLPFLQRHLGITFTAALVKGRGNYLCLRKAHELRAEPRLFADDTVRAEIERLLEWAESTEDGSLADLGFLPRPDAWESVRVEPDDCLRTRCPEYEQCFFYRARRAAANADLLIVNHSLLLIDLALRAELGDDEHGGILPRASRLVVDEAHHLEDVSTDHLGSRMTLARVERPLARLQNTRVPERGILPALLERLFHVSAVEDRPAAEGAARWIEERLRRRATELHRDSARVFDALRIHVSTVLPREATGASDAADERTLRVLPVLRETAVWNDVRALVVGLATEIEAFVEDVHPVLDRISSLSEETAARLLFLTTQLAAQAARLAATAADLLAFLGDDPAFCRWFAIRPDRANLPAVSLCFAPVEVGPQLRETLFGAFDAVVLTSATLTVEKRFDYFFDRTGIAGLPPDSVQCVRLPSPFRYEDQALLVIPEDLPEPDRAGYEERLHAVIERILRASRGGAFVLFTSYAALRRAFSVLADPLDASGIEILRQGEADRHTLLQRFRRNPRAALFATDSFWEGVDVRGDGLRAVLIPRLPFRVPTEPIQQARMEAIEARGGNPFDDYGLPQAVIKLRQGFGRLIRSREDTGVVAILDSRTVRRRYGEVFLASLPPAPVVRGPATVVLPEVEKFFRGISV